MVAVTRRRVNPPTAAPVRLVDLGHGAAASVRGPSYRRRVLEDLGRYFDVPHVYLVSSGKAALVLVLRALSAGSSRRTVIIPAYTCFSVPSAVLRAGCRLRLCDVDPETLDFDYSRLAEALDDDTLCVVATHLFGVPADVKRLRSLCNRAGALVVEDAAQAMGGEICGRKLGTIGDVGFFSLGRGKTVSCEGGGIIVTRSRAIAAALDRASSVLGQPGMLASARDLLKAALTSLFIRPALYWLPANLPFLGLGQTSFDLDFPVDGLSNAKLGLLRSWRARLENHQRQRRANAAGFRTRLGGEALPAVGLPYLRFPVLAASAQARERLFEASRAAGLGLSPMYPFAVADIEELRSAFAGEAFPGARRLAETLVTVPTHGMLTVADRAAICELLAGHVRALPERAPVNVAARRGASGLAR